MRIKAADVTVVFQGPVLPGPEGTAQHIRRTRQAFPHARYVLSTWDHSDCRGIDVDRIVFSDDPGGLPGIKRRDGASELNNVNRQLRSTERGLAASDTPYALKIRTDCSLEHAELLREYERFSLISSNPRILASSIFTVDPTMFEQMAYHVSDWVQFGETAVLQAYWSTPFMNHEDATYYERHPHAVHSTFMDRRFRCRLAVEQYVASSYAERLGYPPPRYHNDVEAEVLAGHRRFLTDRIVIMDPWRMGLRFPKYAWAYRSGFQRLNCLLFEDWYCLYLEQGGIAVESSPFTADFRSRKQRKRLARLLSQWTDRAGPLLIRPGCKQMINRVLAVLARGQAVWSDARSGSVPSRTSRQ